MRVTTMITMAVLFDTIINFSVTKMDGVVQQIQVCKNTIEAETNKIEINEIAQQLPCIQHETQTY